MTDDTQPEAMDLADWLEAVGGGPSAKRCAALLREQHARIAELESELEAAGAGGVQALSAAPGVTSEQRRLIGVIADKIEDGTLFQSGIYPKKDLARFVRNMLDTTPTAPAASLTPPAEQQATKETSGGFHVWRDISTAPKDGSRFVATGHNYGLYSEVRHTCVAQWFRGCWMEASDWNETSELKYLTHWMPLPSPPDDVAAPAEQQTAPKAALATQQAGEREQERIAFKDAHRHLELYEVPDAWGRPMFKHSHVEASWLGWIARASRGQAPAETGNSVSAQADSVQEDAARYRFIRDVPYSDDVRSVLVHQQNAAMDRVIDAARKQGASHDR